MDRSYIPQDLGTLVAKFWLVYAAAALLSISYALVRNRMRLVPAEVHTKDLLRLFRVVLGVGAVISIGLAVGLVIIHGILYFAGQRVLLAISITITVIVIVLVSGFNAPSSST